MRQRRWLRWLQGEAWGRRTLLSQRIGGGGGMVPPSCWRLGLGLAGGAGRRLLPWQRRPGREDGAKRLAAVVAVASDPSPPSAGGGAPAPVAVVMGSDSDLPTLQPAVAILRELGVACEVRVLSAHRTPLEMVAFAEAAAARGLRVIIAGAGGAAHLPGMVAALTLLPVIGVPVQSRALSGVDSLHSIVQMPAGIPVATVAIGNGANAGLLAAQILALADADLAQRLAAHRRGLHDQVRAKDERLQQLGSDAYLQSMGA